MKLSLDEQNVVHLLLDLNETEEKNCLRNIWDKFVPDTYITMAQKPATYIEAGRRGGLSSQLLAKQLTSKILLLIEVLQRLEDERLIIPYTSSATMKTLGSKIDENEDNKIILARALLSKLKERTSQEFGISESLVELAQNRFVSDEEVRLHKDLKRANRNLLCTWIALIISLLSGIPSLVDMFSDRIEKVELTPKSRVQVFEPAPEDEPE